MIKDRLGEPLNIRILSKWCKATGRDVVLMTFATDEGDVEIFCPIGFLNGEETALEGWIGAATSTPAQHENSPVKEAVRGIDHLRGLFDEGPGTSTPVQQDQLRSPVWRTSKQRSFGDLSDQPPAES